MLSERRSETHALSQNVFSCVTIHVDDGTRMIPWDVYLLGQSLENKDHIRRTTGEYSYATSSAVSCYSSNFVSVSVLVLMEQQFHRLEISRHATKRLFS
jgi:hypothetical protein